MTSIYVSLVIAQLASFAVTLLLTERDPFKEPFFWIIVILGLGWALGALSLWGFGMPLSAEKRQPGSNNEGFTGTFDIRSTPDS